MNLELRNLVLDRQLAVLDLESTGLDPARDRIVEVAVLTFSPGRPAREWHTLVCPGVPVPPAAARVHGLTDTALAAAPPFAEVARDLRRELHECDLAGFGIVNFDLPLLVAEFARAGQQFSVGGRSVVDGLRVFHRMEPRTLAAAVRLYLGRCHDRAHTAAADARAAAEVVDRQVGRYGLPRTPAGIHRALFEVDVAGRFRRDGAGRVVFGFGKYRDRDVAEIARADPGYVDWVAGLPLLDDAREVLRQAIGRRVR